MVIALAGEGAKESQGIVNDTTNLGFGDNDIGAEGAKELAALFMNETLTELSLPKINKANERKSWQQL